MNVTYVPGGHSVNLAGTTQHGNPPLDLGGTVLEDVLRPFSATQSGAPAITGTLQDRVVRMGDGTLAFYLRIKEFSGSRGVTEMFVTWLTTAARPTLNLDFRIDGLGTVGPSRVTYENSCAVRWTFNPPITPTALGRFMFMIVPGVTRYVRPGASGNSMVGISNEPYWATSPAIPCFGPDPTDPALR